MEKVLLTAAVFAALATYAGGEFSQMARIEMRPGETLNAVRDRVRMLPKDVRDRGVEVQLLPGRIEGAGTLRLEARDGNVVWRGAADGSTRLVGSETLDWRLFRPVTDVGVLARLDGAARGKVLAAALPQIGLKRPVFRSERQMPMPVPELFLDGERMSVATWPNGTENWMTIKKIVSKGGAKSDGSAAHAAGVKKIEKTDNVGGVFTYDGDRPERWTQAKDVWLWGYWAFDWSERVIPAAKIDTAKKEVTLALPHVYGVKQGNPSPRRWKAVHLLEEIDMPGEYYFDFETKNLYFWPPKTEGRLSVAWRETQIVVVGAKNVTFRGFSVEECYGAGAWLDHCSGLAFENIRFRNLRGSAVESRGLANCVFRGCDVACCGTGGIKVNGGDRKTLTRADNLIENCRVRRFSEYMRCYANGVVLSGVGNVMRNCEVSDAPHQGVSISGNEMLVENCVFSNLVNSSDDAGAIYKGRDPSKRGNVIRNCFFKDIGSPRGHGTAAIYFDDGDVGERVEGCVFLRCGYPGRGSFGTVFCHGGFSNAVENCVFVDCERPLGSAPWSDKHWKEYVDAPLWQKRLLQDVDITKPPYITRYPDFKGFMDPQPGQARDMLATRNVIVRPKTVKSGRWVTNATDVVYTEDPGFANAAAGDLSLRPDSRVFTDIPGFRPIDFSRIGPSSR